MVFTKEIYFVRNTIKFLNKVFIESIRGRGRCFMKIFHKIPCFSGDGLPKFFKPKVQRKEKYPISSLALDVRH